MLRQKERAKNSILRALAIHGPASRWQLAGKVFGKEKPGLTKLSQSHVQRLITELEEQGKVRKMRPARGEKHKIIPYGLTIKGLEGITDLFNDRNKLEEFEKRELKEFDEREREWIKFSLYTFKNPNLRNILHYRDRLYLSWPDTLAEKLVEIATNPRLIITIGKREVGKELQKDTAEKIVNAINSFLSPIIRRETVEAFRKFLDYKKKEARFAQEFLRNLKSRGK